MFWVLFFKMLRCRPCCPCTPGPLVLGRSPWLRWKVSPADPWPQIAGANCCPKVWTTSTAVSFLDLFGDLADFPTFWTIIIWGMIWLILSRCRKSKVCWATSEPQDRPVVKDFGDEMFRKLRGISQPQTGGWPESLPWHLVQHVLPQAAGHGCFVAPGQRSTEAAGGDGGWLCAKGTLRREKNGRSKVGRSNFLSQFGMLNPSMFMNNIIQHPCFHRWTNCFEWLEVGTHLCSQRPGQTAYEIAKQTPVLQALDAEHLTLINRLIEADAMHFVSVVGGQVLYREKDPVENAYIVLSGSVQQYSTDHGFLRSMGWHPHEQTEEEDKSVRLMRDPSRFDEEAEVNPKELPTLTEYVRKEGSLPEDRLQRWGLWRFLRNCMGEEHHGHRLIDSVWIVKDHENAGVVGLELILTLAFSAPWDHRRLCRSLADRAWAITSMLMAKTAHLLCSRFRTLEGYSTFNQELPRCFSFFFFGVGIFSPQKTWLGLHAGSCHEISLLLWLKPKGGRFTPQGAAQWRRIRRFSLWSPNAATHNWRSWPVVWDS